MKLFLDTANLADIQNATATGILDGVTTNPTLIAREKSTHRETIQAIAGLVQGDISVEVASLDVAGMLREAGEFVTWSEHVVVKLPTTVAGITACKRLSEEGVRVNMTLCFSAAQALLVAKAGAVYCSPFVGRLDDLSQSGIQLIHDIAAIYTKHELETLILAASIRSPLQVVECAKAGSHVCTLPAKVFFEMFHHPLTDAGLVAFADAANAKPVS